MPLRLRNSFNLSSLDAPGMFLTNLVVWKSLGPRMAWVSFGVGFEGGRYFRRRASTMEPLPLCQQPNNNDLTIQVRWTDHRGLIKDDVVPIAHLHPAPPSARGKEGVILTGQHQGKLISVRKYSRKSRKLTVSVDGEVGEWEEPEDNVCCVENSDVA
jgi:hypothetical protein